MYAQSVTVPFIPHIPIRRNFSHKFPGFLFHVYGRTHFLGNIFCIHIMQDRLQRNKQCIVFFPVETVKPVIYGDKADMQTWKYGFKILACLQIIPSKTG